ncbi:hypothetical protein Bbelb_380820 [Branchiostoma belcheri]|nr:hypothetical protein Bbelb_380820 [Branchiostoma belcheri]
MIENGIAGLYGHGVNRVDTSLAVVPRLFTQQAYRHVIHASPHDGPSARGRYHTAGRYDRPGCTTLPDEGQGLTPVDEPSAWTQYTTYTCLCTELDVVRVAHLSADKWKQENAPPHVEQTELLSICQLNVYRLASLGCIPQQQTPGVGRSCRPAQGTDAKFSAHRQLYRKHRSTELTVAFSS